MNHLSGHKATQISQALQNTRRRASDRFEVDRKNIEHARRVRDYLEGMRAMWKGESLC